MSVQVSEGSVEFIASINDKEVVAQVDAGKGVTFDTDVNDNLLVTNLSTMNSLSVLVDGDEMIVNPGEILTIESETASDYNVILFAIVGIIIAVVLFIVLYVFLRP